MLHNNELISVEEILVKPPRNDYERPIRQFILFNRNSDLKICIYTLGARVMSCMLNDHQIILGDNNDNNTNNEEESINNFNNLRLSRHHFRNFDEPTNDEYWDSHVFGSDTVLLNYPRDFLLSTVKKLTYCLTKDNEFIIEGSNTTFGVKNWKINPFFFNLNSVENQPCLDEHYLHIRASHESINIFTEQEPSSFYGQFIDRQPSVISNRMDGVDLIYSTNPSTIPDSFLIATLRYKNRIIEIELAIDTQTKSNLKILIKNGSIAFVPHDMNKFRVTYRFHW